jgi:hypothetical protein
MSKTCVACGMPMSGTDDFPKGDMSKDYCLYCAKPDGTMQGYDEKLKGYAGWLTRTQGLDSLAALDQAKTILLQLPAWKHLGE